MAAAKGMEKNDWLRHAIASAVHDQGGNLPEECPENFVRGWPEGSANHMADRLIREALPEIEAMAGDYAYQSVPERFAKLMTDLRELNSPSVANYAREKFLDPALTPLNRIHYVEERIRAAKKVSESTR